MFKQVAKIILLLSFTLSSLTVYPRAGGSGGDDDESSYSSSDDNDSYSSSSSDDDDNDNSSSYDYSSDDNNSSSGGKANPVFTAIIGIVIACVVIAGLIITYFERKKEKAKIKQAGINKSSGPPVPAKISEEFLKANPGFDEKEFKQKARIAFMQIQEAWQNQNLGNVRKWISDGVYQRFHLQIEMMKKLGQINKLSNISINNIDLVKAKSDGPFSTLTVLISFSMDDEFNCPKMPELNVNYKGSKASEYWTFVKRSGQTKGNLYQSNDCPNCSAPLNNNNGEVSKCSSCGTITYLGEYDWVLADITQKNDYNRDQSGLKQNSAVFNTLKQEEEFCLQVIEDKAANAFINILIAHASCRTDRLYRYASNEVISFAINTKPYLFNRLYVINVLPANYENANGKHTIMFKVAYGAQRVDVSEDNISKIDNDLVKKEGYLFLSRKAGNKISKSKHWSYECAHCGNPFDDTTLDKCNSCQSVINSGEYDWVVSKIQNIF